MAAGSTAHSADSRENEHDNENEKIDVEQSPRPETVVDSQDDGADAEKLNVKQDNKKHRRSFFRSSKAVDSEPELDEKGDPVAPAPAPTPAKKEVQPTSFTALFRCVPSSCVIPSPLIPNIFSTEQVFDPERALPRCYWYRVCCRGRSCAGASGLFPPSPASPSHTLTSHSARHSPS